MRISLTAGTAMLALAASAAPALATPATFGYTGATQSYIATQAGTYAITAAGAQGGSSPNQSGADGAQAGANFGLVSGVPLTIVVGGEGGHKSGIGGGSFLDAGSVNQVLTLDTNVGSGFVSIELLPALQPPLPAPVPVPASAALLALGVPRPPGPARLSPC